MKSTNIGFADNGKSSIKSNRNLNKRAGFFESYKKISRKFNFKKNENLHPNEMTESEILLLRKKLISEQRTKLFFQILLITVLVVIIFIILSLI